MHDVIYMKGEGKHWGINVSIIYNTYSDIHETGRKHGGPTNQPENQRTNETRTKS